MLNDKFNQKMTAVLDNAEKIRVQIDAGAAGHAEVTTKTLDALLETLEELHVAQEELTQTNAELEETRLLLETEKYRYESLFEFAPDGYFVTDMQGVIQEANAIAAILLGYRPDHLTGKPLSVFVHEADLPAFRSQLNQFSTQEGLTDWEITIVARENHPFSASLTVAVFRNPAGERSGLRWMLRDISASVKIKQALQNSHDELEERVEDRTYNLNVLVEAMTGREVRMAELKRVIRKLRRQIEQAGMTPIANDPLEEYH